MKKIIKVFRSDLFGVIYGCFCLILSLISFFVLPFSCDSFFCGMCFAVGLCLFSVSLIGIVKKAPR